MGSDGAITKYLDHLRTRNFAPATLRYKRAHITRFRWWLIDDGVPSSLAAITEQTARAYRRSLAEAPMSTMSWAAPLFTVKVFFRWLQRHDLILVDPFERIDIPRREQTLPTYLTQTEMKKLLTSTPAEDMLRDRAVLEVLYSSALRIGELVRLEVSDVDLSNGVLFVRQGKGKKDRVVPVGRIACTLVGRYVRKERVATRSQKRFLFVTHEGQQMNESHVRKYILLPALERAEIEKHVTLHVLRHSCAIHLLENGASVRYIQALLGHAKLSTTQKYLTVVPTELKKAHSASHPSEHQRRPEAVTPTRLAPSKWDASRTLREGASGDDLPLDEG